MRVLATAAFSFVAAVLLAQYLLPVSWQLWAAVGMAVLLPFMLLIRWKHRNRLCLVLLGAALGLGWNTLYDRIALAPARELDGETVTVTAQAIDWPQETAAGWSIRVRLEEELRRTSAILYGKEELSRLKPGDRVSFSGTFQLADKMGGEETDYYFSRGVFLTARRLTGVEILSEREGFSLRWLPQDLKRAIRMRILEVFPERTEALALALLTGDKSLLNREIDLRVSMERAGLVHLATVSGMHVSLLAGFIGLLTGKRRGAVLLTLPVLVLFAGVSGFAPSVMRAVMMQGFLLLAPLVGREEDRLTSLSVSAVVLLLANPFTARHVGFQLSFGSMLGIVLFSERLYRRLTGFERFQKARSKRLKRLWSILAGGLSVTLGAMSVTSPLTALHFGTVSLAAPFTNLAVLWAVTPAFLLSILAVAAGFLWVPLGTFFAWIASAPLLLIMLAARSFSRFFLSSLYITSPGLAVWLAGLYLMLLLLIGLRVRPREMLLPMGILAGLLGVLLLGNALRTSLSPGYTLSCLDVGQGQCLVISSGGRTAVIDCGSTSGENAGETCARYLAGTGTDRVDVLLLTHYDWDHISGVRELMARCRVAALAAPVPDETDGENAALLLREAQARHVTFIPVTDDTTVSLGSTVITLYPPMGDGSRNQRSLCMLVTDGSFDTLITGDADAQVERTLLGTRALPDIECLVVGHHGSRYATSRELLATLRPEVGVISVGRQNTYGQPAEETLERLEEAGVTVHRTDEEGTVTVFSGGRLAYG